MPNVTGQPRVTGGLPGGGAALNGAVAATASSTVATVIAGPPFLPFFTVAADAVLLRGDYDVVWQTAARGSAIDGNGLARLLIDVGGGFIQQGDNVSEKPGVASQPSMFVQTTPITIATPTMPDVSVEFSDRGVGSWQHVRSIIQFVRRSA